MIQRKPIYRLGLNGPDEVKSHQWFADFPWDDLNKGRIQSPFIPPKNDNFDLKNINEEWKDLDDPTYRENKASLRDNEVQK